MIYGYVYRKGTGIEYFLSPQYPISLQLFLEKYAITYSVDPLERFVFLGDNPLVPDAIYVATWVKIQDVPLILAEEYGIDAVLVS